MKVFKSVVPDPAPGENYSLRYHPVQGFQWGDYSAKPGRKYTYRVAIVHAPVTAPTLGAHVDVTVTTEAEDDGVHGVWFNRGVAGSQAWNAKYGPPSKELIDPNSSAWGWLSRGLGEALLATVASAADASWSIHGAFYEFTWDAGLKRSRRRETGEWPPTWWCTGATGTQTGRRKTRTRRRLGTGPPPTQPG